MFHRSVNEAGRLGVYKHGPPTEGSGVWQFWVALLAAPKLEQFTKHLKITGREEGFIPAPLLSASLSESREERG